DCGANIRVQKAQKAAAFVVEPLMVGTVRVVVNIAGMPLSVTVDVFTAYPCAVATIVIVAGRRLTLLHDTIFNRYAALVQLNDSTAGLGAQFCRCHDAPSFLYSHG